ncbi:AAA15 family ATPase/GTPase [Salibacterium salarium]|nr:AAA15 family ATPase/GTPase [Salibacterium salarium]
MIIIIMEALKNNRVLCIDELEISLHPHLLHYIVEQFHDSSINTANSQLLFTTHNTSLQHKNLFRRDQIWITEKKEETMESVLYSLSELKIRNDENFEIGYLTGRYGGTTFDVETSTCSLNQLNRKPGYDFILVD